MEQTDKTRQTRREDLMLRGSLPKVITKMAVPSIISFLITSIYNLADTFLSAAWGRAPRRR